MYQVENPMILNIEDEEHVKIALYCDECGTPIYEEEIYYKIDDINLCLECFHCYVQDNFKTVARSEGN